MIQDTKHIDQSQLIANLITRVECLERGHQQIPLIQQQLAVITLTFTDLINDLNADINEIDDKFDTVIYKMPEPQIIQISTIQQQIQDLNDKVLAFGRDLAQTKQDTNIQDFNDRLLAFGRDLDQTKQNIKKTGNVYEYYDNNELKAKYAYDIHGILRYKEQYRQDNQLETKIRYKEQYRQDNKLETKYTYNDIGVLITKETTKYNHLINMPVITECVDCNNQIQYILYHQANRIYRKQVYDSNNQVIFDHVYHNDIYQEIQNIQNKTTQKITLSKYGGFIEYIENIPGEMIYYSYSSYSNPELYSKYATKTTSTDQSKIIETSDIFSGKLKKKETFGRCTRNGLQLEYIYNYDELENIVSREHYNSSSQLISKEIY